MQKCGCKRISKLPIFFPNDRVLLCGSLSGVQNYNNLLK